MEAIAVIAGAVAIVWGILLLQRGGLLAGCLAVLLAGTCFSVPFFKLELGPLPITADRLLLALLLGQYVLWRRFGWTDSKPLGRREFVLLAFLGVLALSTFSSDWHIRNCQPLSWLIVSYVMPAVLYWIARETKYSERDVKFLFGAFALFGVYLAVTAVAEHFKWSFLVFPRYILTSATQADAEFVGRGRGPLLNPIANGILLTACLAGALMWWPRLGRWGQLLLAAMVVLFAAGFYCTLTRSVWMSGLLAMCMAVGLAVPRSWRLPIVGSVIAVIAILAATQWEDLLAFKRDEALSAEKTAESVELRPIMARVTWNMFLDRPLLGCGYAQYQTESLAYLSDRSTDMALERARGYIPHNIVFSLLAETGLVGLALFAALAYFWTADGWRLWSDPTLPLWVRQQGLLLLIALGAYFVNGMFHEVSVVPMANLTLFFLAGVTESLRGNCSPRAA